eukprot:CAMPEP_0116917770 /NCGR_PEP_ID=MMETSP0467-20121206/19354_1 /TAXON_ID=283647 /ORGANISM="Mesodinium pulex, Strain SPMC105" /LENGTH=76 /DNA_ID=CAMNT_0004594953 /DNA_START=310 /DNA_END=540 /DNA_ORIENTATION=-
MDVELAQKLQQQEYGNSSGFPHSDQHNDKFINRLDRNDDHVNNPNYFNNDQNNYNFNQPNSHANQDRTKNPEYVKN